MDILSIFGWERMSINLYFCLAVNLPFDHHSFICVLLLCIPVAPQPVIREYIRDGNGGRHVRVVASYAQIL